MWILVFFLILMVVAVALILRNMKIKQMEEENRLMQEYMKSIEDSYTAIQDRIEAVRKYRHDLAKHIQTLEYILEHETAKGSQADMNDNMSQTEKKIYCSDEIINSILDEKVNRCVKLAIPLDISIEDTTYNKVRELDMAGILHNLLDNAIEANERIPDTEKRGVFLAMGMKEDTVWIELKNYLCPWEIVTFETKKECREEHGFGIRIINEIVRKYNGKSEHFFNRKEHILNQKIYLSTLFSVPDMV